MRCSHCGTQIEGSNGTCPLCGAPMDKQHAAFPPRKAKVSRVIVPFTEVYFSIAIVATVVLGIVNYFFRPEIQYWLIGVVAAWYGYITLRRTILGLENTHYKILGQTITLLLLLYTIAAVLHSDLVVEWIIPIFYGVIWLTNVVFALASPHRALRFFASFWAQNLLGGLTIPCQTSG